MKYDFETIKPRYHKGSVKWDEMLDYGVKEDDDIVPFSVADMEFMNAPEILNALRKQLDEMTLGYIKATPEYLQTVCDWMKKRHGWEADPSWIVNTHGVVEAFFAAVKLFTKEGDGVIIMPPVYFPMYYAVNYYNRRLVENPLINKGNTYEIDFDDLEKKASDPGTKLLLLCSPHNPTGRCFSREELTKLSEICLRHDVLVIADEIHNDLIMPGYEHTVYASISEEAKDHCMILTAPTKTFNMAGMQLTNIFIPNQEMRDIFIKDQLYHFNNNRNSIQSYTACMAAYTKGEDWLSEAISVIDHNRQLVEDFMASEFPMVKVHKLEATYLLWIDLRGLGIDYQEIERINRKEARLFLDEGYIFGASGQCFERWNLACPSRYIEEALLRFKQAYKDKVYKR